MIGIYTFFYKYIYIKNKTNLWHGQHRVGQSVINKYDI